MVVYFLFGKIGSIFWDGLYFCTWNSVLVYLCHLLINKFRDKLLNIILKLIMGVSVFKLIFSIYSFFDIEIYNTINNSYHAGGVIVSCMVIFLIYRNHGQLVKRKV